MPRDRFRAARAQVAGAVGEGAQASACGRSSRTGKPSRSTPTRTRPRAPGVRLAAQRPSRAQRQTTAVVTPGAVAASFAVVHRATPPDSLAVAFTPAQYQADAPLGNIRTVTDEERQAEEAAEQKASAASAAAAELAKRKAEAEAEARRARPLTAADLADVERAVRADVRKEMAELRSAASAKAASAKKTGGVSAGVAGVVVVLVLVVIAAAAAIVRRKGA